MVGWNRVFEEERMNAIRKKVHQGRYRWLTRCKVPSKSENKGGGVVYWMFREQRVEDNWALHRANELAREHGQKLSVLFLVVPTFESYNARHFDFMLRGMEHVASKLSELNIPLQVEVSKDPVETVLKHVGKGSTLVSDFMPLRANKEWKKALIDKLNERGDTPFVEVDARNIVPVWEASNKLEYAARTIRKKITSRLDEFLDEFPDLKQLEQSKDNLETADVATYDRKRIWDELLEQGMDTSVDPVSERIHKPGYEAGMERLEDFCTNRNRLAKYSSLSNDPNASANSSLSVYFHFGQITAHRAALRVHQEKTLGGKSLKGFKESVDSFLEELIVRKELTDNFCYYNQHYDSLQGASDWARKTLKDHENDKREKVYSYEELEGAETHNALWNAAQKQLLVEGKMANYLRMYWAKQILAWTESPAKALEIAQKLNDRFALDGNDPNGYVGVGWSIMGIHDQGWGERDVFGKIRYMNESGCKRKFNIQAYIDRCDRQYKETLHGHSTSKKRKRTD